MSELLTALATAFAVPALSIIWFRRHKTPPEAAESLVFGLLILAAAIACLYYALSLPMAGEDELLGILVALLKILVFAGEVFGAMAGAGITCESHKLS